VIDLRSILRSRTRGALLALMSAATLALGVGANAPITASADTVADAGVVAITGIATLNGAPSAFPCVNGGGPGTEACPSTFAGNCVAGASVSLPGGAEPLDPTSILGARVGATGVGDGCGAVNDGGDNVYWEPPGGGAGTAHGTLVVKETYGESGVAAGDGDTFTESFIWVRVGLTAAVILTNVCESPGCPATGAGAAAAVFVPGVAALGDSTCLPTATTSCAGPWKVFIASVGAFAAGGSD
jgi:hypothetical protein